MIFFVVFFSINKRNYENLFDPLSLLVGGGRMENEFKASRRQNVIPARTSICVGD